MKAAMGAVDPTKEACDDHRPRRRFRAAPQLIPDRPGPPRTPALRLPSLPRRARSQTASRSEHSRRQHLRHLRRLGGGAYRHPPRTRP
ncbi:Hypothetical protein GbCGDNIH8_8721 [Granulibacter bethesdensis]|nr:Hypothetical protein GbCGDNIH8_8721 [Granulibacter bethesdensis]